MLITIFSTKDRENHLKANISKTQTTREDLLQNVKKETEFSTEQQSINLQNKVDLPNGEEQLTERLHWEDRFIFWGGLFFLKKVNYSQAADVIKKVTKSFD